MSDIGIMVVYRSEPRFNNMEIVKKFLKYRPIGSGEIITSSEINELVEKLLSGELRYIICPASIFDEERMEKENRLEKSGVMHDVVFFLGKNKFYSFVRKGKEQGIWCKEAGKFAIRF